jgi:putative ABC transport system permease protein
MSLTEGLRKKVENDLTALGAGAFHVQKYPAIGLPSTDWSKYRKRKALSDEQTRAVEENCPHVARVSPERFTWPPEKIATKDRSTKPNIFIAGGTPQYEPVNGYVVEEGRFISDVDMSLARRVVVIGADVRDALFPDGHALGETVRIRATTFTVIGVLERMGTVLGLASKDTIAVVPMPAFEMAFGHNVELELGVQAISPDQVNQAQDETIAQLRRLRHLASNEENDFEIFSNDSLTSMFNNIAATIAAATFGVCALALIVGGIGIMNIMLVSVVERTREIGIRKALGARRRRILSQFVVEAITLSLLGGLIGVVVGAAVAIGAREIYTVPASIPLWAIVLALVSSSGCGLLFGIYPAMRASRLDPVEAMRTE